jgi:hypothetical protein
MEERKKEKEIANENKKGEEVDPLPLRLCL